MRKITWFVFMGILFYGCSNNAVSTQNKQETPDEGTMQTTLNRGVDKEKLALEMNKQKLLKAGMVYLNQSKIPEAIRAMNQAVLLDPRDTSSAFVLAQTYIHLKKYDIAVGVLDNIIEMQPDNGRAYYLKSLASGLAGNTEQAIESAHKSIVLFQEQRDEKNFKMAIVLLRGLSAEGSSEELSSIKNATVPRDAVSSNVFADSPTGETSARRNNTR